MHMYYYIYIYIYIYSHTYTHTYTYNIFIPTDSFTQPLRCRHGGNEVRHRRPSLDQ